MDVRDWVVLSDHDGRYRNDVLSHLPRDGEQVFFESMNTVFLGTFHDGSGSKYFRTADLADILFLVVRGRRCEVARWAAVKKQ